MRCTVASVAGVTKYNSQGERDEGNDRQEAVWPMGTDHGASSGIGREFARQIAASGVNVVLVARREALLEEAGAEFTKDFGVEHRIIAADLSEEGFIKKLASVTDDLDIGLAVSNAGTGNPGKFLTRDRDEMAALLRLDAAPRIWTLPITFAPGSPGADAEGSCSWERWAPTRAFLTWRMTRRQRHMSRVSRSRSMSSSKPLGVHVTVLPAAPTETPVLAKFGLTPETMPMKPMKVERCVSEGLKALRDNRSLIIPGAPTGS